MLIKFNNQTDYRDKLDYLKKKKTVAVIVVFLVYSFGLILFSGVLHRDGFFGEVLRPLLLENINIPINYFKGLQSHPEHLTIDIKHKDYQKLAYKRKVAIAEGVLHPFPEDWVPGKIRWQGKSIKVKMRLKGDLGDHWSRDYKWSFRIKTKAEKAIMGMRSFSIQHPRTRGFLNDWHLHKILERYGFITLRFDFVDVTVNGKHLGIYNIEEHFEQTLLANNSRINGPIIRIKDHLLWYRIEPDGFFTVDTIDELYTSSPIDAFTTSTINLDPELRSNFGKAKNLLELFRRGELLTHQVFDVEKMSRLFAILDLFGYRHTSAYSNIRFYYNPVTSLLVPIGYDNTFIETAASIEGQEKLLKLAGSNKQEKLDWKATFFRDKLFYKMYINALQEISKQRFLDSFFDEVEDEYNEKLNFIYKSFPGYSFRENKEILYNNQKFIRKILDPLEGIQAYIRKIDDKANELSLEIGNIQFLPIEILSVSYGEEAFSPLNEIKILQSKKPFDVMEFKQFKFDIPKRLLSSKEFADNLKINYKLFGSNNIKSIAVFPWPYLDKEFLETDFIRQKSNFTKFDFIDVNNKDQLIFIKPGSWELNENLIIPEGYIVICNEGTELNLTNFAKILSYSPIQFIGESTKPIVFKSDDSTGQGIVVIKAKAKSIVKEVIFDNLASPSQDGWKLKAGVTFYESDVELSNSQFSNTRAPAALDIIRSDFSIDKSQFTNSLSGSLRVIFSKGSIKKSVFSNVGGDGIYLSRSMLDGDELYINDVSSVAINANNDSKVNIGNVEIVDSQTASVSRNESDVTYNNIVIENVEYGFVVFNQKKEFGPGAIKANSAKMINLKYENLVEKGSILVINQVEEQDFHTDFSSYY